MFIMEGDDFVRDLCMLDAADDANKALSGLVTGMIEMLEPLGGDSIEASKSWKRALLITAAERCFADDENVVSLDDFLKEAAAAYKYYSGDFDKVAEAGSAQNDG